MSNHPENPVPFPYERDRLSVESDVISTGDLPEPAVVEKMMQKTYDLYADLGDGVVASYIPKLAEADPRWFGLTLASATGRRFSSGDCRQEFSIQSIAKAFVYALVCESIGHDEVRERIGVNNTGLPFNSVMARSMPGRWPRRRWYPANRGRRSGSSSTRVFRLSPVACLSSTTRSTRPRWTRICAI